MDVIKRLNELRLERDMSVYRLSELTGINQSTLANTFSRGTVPSIKNLELICQALGITLAQFFTDDEEPSRLTARERHLVHYYRKLPRSVQESLDNIVTNTDKKD